MMQDREKGVCKMKELYITVTGMNYYYGTEFIEKGMTVKLVKEPDNEYDKEAIAVKIAGLDKIGYVANSPYTVLGESISAGRIYDKIEDEKEAKVLYPLAQGVICKIVLDDEAGIGEKLQ